MASDESAFINRIATRGRTKRYLASSSHGAIMFEDGLVAPGSLQSDDAQLMGTASDVSSLVASIGMTPAGFEMPEGEIPTSGYNARNGIPVDTAVAPKPQIRSKKKRGPFKGTWTKEEDSILKDMVGKLGGRRWSVIAQSLPGRIGKQCRERWINHLHPDIKEKKMWTLEEDKVLIEAHASHGKHWATIAKKLPGWTENAIKNHWNSTKRSLKSKRRLKKKRSQQVPPGEFTILEKYIRSLQEDSESAPTPQPPASPLAAPTPEMEMHLNLNAPNQVAPTMRPHQPRETINLGNSSLLPDLNISYDPQGMHYPMYAPAAMSAPQLQLVNQGPQQTTFNWFPFIEPLAALNREHTYGPSYYVGESSSNVVGANDYYNYNYEAGPSNVGGGSDYYNYIFEAGPSNVGGGSAYYNYNHEAGPSNVGGGSDDPACYDNNEFRDLASREFIMPSSEEISLGLDRFK